ncbi:hypothetical protein [Geodermatophilus normandii]|uniref:hypothetical protein n=1 Tax=Geodermatophilus normandii TaxID=1137989 RepID=UPI001FEAE0D0|nr:hypothetical protein [Geodermatophilus normandii]
MTVRQVGVIAGPLAAGLLIALGDIFVAYLVDAATLLVAAVLIRGLPPLPRPAWPGRCARAPRCAGWARASRSCAPSRCCS